MNEFEIKKLEEAIKKSWDGKTCYPPLAGKWTIKNPSLGQCAVTALIVQDLFGGELMHCTHKNHYWNLLPDKTEVDLTRGQFPPNAIICFDKLVTRQYLLDGKAAIIARTKERYELLKQRVQNAADKC
jgi:hypothetical protein